MPVCRVIMAGRMPLSLPFFDYSIPKDLEDLLRVGQLVKIPVRGKEHYGIILGFPEKAPFKNGRPLPLKPISSLCNAESALPPQQLDFIQEMAEFYAVSPGFLVKTALFELTKKNSALFQTLRRSPTNPSPTTPIKPSLFIHTTEEEKRDFLLEKLDSTGQNLILVPEVHQLKTTAHLLFGFNFEDHCVLLSSDTKQTEATQLWFSVWNGKPLTVIATRAALFLPWTNLRSSIILDEANPDYKSWDMAPRYETRDAVFFLSKQHGSPVTLVSHTPSVESYFFAKKKIYSFASKRETPFATDTLELINLADEERGGNYSFFADTALAGLKTALDSGDVFILVQHRGSVSSVFCRDCGFVPRCETCERPLSYHEDTKELVCHFCRFHKPMIVLCPTCQGTDLAPRGIGTQKVERELRRKLKESLEKINFVRIDSDSESDPVFEIEKHNLVIGTERALRFINWAKITLTLLVDPDTLLFIPEYKMVERLWQTIRSIEYSSQPQARILVQTKHPEHVVFAHVNQPERFYVKELQQRRFFGYPPFNFIVKLSFGHAHKNICEQEAGRLFTTLQRLTQGQKGVMLTHPLPTTPTIYKKRSWQVLLIKVDYRNYKKTIKELLKHVPEGWKVDPNPTSLLGF